MLYYLLRKANDKTLYPIWFHLLKKKQEDWKEIQQNIDSSCVWMTRFWILVFLHFSYNLQFPKISSYYIYVRVERVGKLIKNKIQFDTFSSYSVVLHCTFSLALFQEHSLVARTQEVRSLSITILHFYLDLLSDRQRGTNSYWVLSWAPCYSYILFLWDRKYYPHF